MATQTKEAPTNGQTKPQTPKAIAEQGKGSDVPFSTPASPKPLPSVEERLAQLERLNIMESKRERFLKKKKELENFSLKSESVNQRLWIEDSEGNKFDAKDPEFILEARNMMLGRLGTAISEIDSQILKEWE